MLLLDISLLYFRSQTKLKYFYEILTWQVGQSGLHFQFATLQAGYRDIPLANLLVGCIPNPQIFSKLLRYNAAAKIKNA